MRRSWLSCLLWLLNPSAVLVGRWQATSAFVSRAWCFLQLAPIRLLAVGSSLGLHPWCDGSFRPRLPLAETITLNSCYVMLCYQNKYSNDDDPIWAPVAVGQEGGAWQLPGPGAEAHPLQHCWLGKACRDLHQEADTGGICQGEG